MNNDSKDDFSKYGSEGIFHLTIFCLRESNPLRTRESGSHLDNASLPFSRGASAHLHVL